MSAIKERQFSDIIHSIGEPMSRAKRQAYGRRPGDEYPKDHNSPDCISCLKHLNNSIPNNARCRLICG